MSQRSVYVVAAEPSGDAFGAEIIAGLKDRQAELRIAGTGGDAMSELGVVSPVDTAPLAVLGLLEGLRAYPAVIRLADAVSADIIAFRPDVVLLVDSWGFNLRVAQRVRKAAPDIKLVKVIGPQVWATRAGRAKTLAATVDHVMCIHSFETPYYDGLDIETSVIGNPALGRSLSVDPAGFRANFGIGEHETLITVLPGSRRSEMKRVAPALIEAAARLKSERPDLRFVVTPSEEVAGMLPETLKEQIPDVIVLEDEDRKFDAVASSTMALACSGTVATEVAMLHIPVIIAYKLGWITWSIARAVGLYKPKYINLLNIAVNEEIVPEFLQTRCKPELIAAEAKRRLKDDALRQRQIEQQDEALKVMGAGKARASDRAVEETLRILGAL